MPLRSIIPGLAPVILLSDTSSNTTGQHFDSLIYGTIDLMMAGGQWLWCSHHGSLCLSWADKPVLSLSPQNIRLTDQHPCFSAGSWFTLNFVCADAELAFLLSGMEMMSPLWWLISPTAWPVRVSKPAAGRCSDDICISLLGAVNQSINLLPGHSAAVSCDLGDGQLLLGSHPHGRLYYKGRYFLQILAGHCMSPLHISFRRLMITAFIYFGILAYNNCLITFWFSSQKM